MIKGILLLAIMAEISLLSFVMGRTHEIKNVIEVNDNCIKEVLSRDLSLEKFYNHKIEVHTIWIHAEAAIALQFQECIYGRRQ